MTVIQETEVLGKFPVGMRVLAVDSSSQTCLQVLQNLFRGCQYHVTTTNQVQTALNLLRENKNKFDLVMSVVDFPVMDGFKLLDIFGLEKMDISVIMLSVHSDPLDARDYLVEPLRINELKNIWQHVLRKNKLKQKKSTVSSGGEIDGNANRKRKDQYEEEEKKRGKENDNPAQKKARLIWTPELHKKFLDAIEDLGGIRKAIPSKIHDLMKVDNLTRYHVASHLQKYRHSLMKMFDEANQQANMTSLNELGGFHHRYPLPVGSGEFHGGATTMTHNPSNWIIGRPNSLAGGMFQSVSSSLFPRNHNDGGNILQRLQLPPLKMHQVNNNNKILQSLYSHQSHPQSSSPSFNPRLSPHFEISKLSDPWLNHVHPKPDVLEWTPFNETTSLPINPNPDTTQSSFIRNMDFESSNATQTDVFDPLQMNQKHTNNSAPMLEDQLNGQQDDILHYLMTLGPSQFDFLDEEDWDRMS